MDRILTWCLNNPKLFAVAAGLVVSLIEAWRQRSKGKAARDALDLVFGKLRGMGFTEPAVMEAASEALQARSRRKARILRELNKSDLRPTTISTAAWVRKEAAKLKGK